MRVLVVAVGSAGDAPPFLPVARRFAERGRWWCLEVNPVPTFLPYEIAAGHPIAHAVLERIAALGGVELPEALPAARAAAG